MQFSVLDHEGFKAFSVTSEIKSLETNEAQKPKSFQYSPCGRWIACIFPEHIRILESQTMKLVAELPQSNVMELSFSANASFITAWSRFVSSENPTPNLLVWNIAEKRTVFSCVQKNGQNWNFEWTSDELYCARLVSTEIQVFKTTQFAKGIHSRIKVEGVSSFSISPGKRYSVCVFVPEKKDQPASVRLYDLLSPTVPMSQKTFFRADSAHFHWNQLGTSILVLTHTDLDKTGQSYYGETNLYFLSIAGNFDCKVALDKQGPVHDVHWSPNSKEFMVVYGTMPAKCTLFDHRGSSMYEFPAAARNFVRFNSQGRIICLAGFGNLAGQIEFWDRKSFKKIGSVNGANTSICEWSPDGRYIMTAIVYRRLKVDNGVKIWHHSGALIHKMETKELYHAAWRLESSDAYPERPNLSPAPVGLAIEPTVSEKKVGVYRPPGARNRPDSGSNSTNGKYQAPVRQIPGMSPIETPPKKNQKKKKPKTPQESIPAVPLVTESSIDPDKKSRNLKKKLRQIQELKERQANGELLVDSQLEKISSESKLLEELASLSVSH